MAARAREHRWTPDAVEIVRELLVDQHQSRAEVAARFNVSRRAIFGVVAPYGLNGHKTARPEPVAEAKPQRTAKFFPDNPHTTPGNNLKELPVETSPRAVNFAQCKNCMWPIGNELFCNRGKIPKSSYCIRHHRRAYLEKCS